MILKYFSYNVYLVYDNVQLYFTILHEKQTDYRYNDEFEYLLYRIINDRNPSNE